jgi:iron complex outermembrane receptor protein
VGTDQRRITAPVTQVPNSYLVQKPSTNIVDALEDIPGVSGITDGQSISKPVIRGQGYNRVVTVNDGIRQEGQQWGDEFGIEVDQNSVDRVEILKGPASLAYGSDAISGVLNLIPENTVPEGSVKGEILLNHQTNNGLVNVSGHIAGNTGGIAWSGRVSSLMAHAYQNDNDGYVLNSQFSSFGADGTVGIHRDWGFSQLHYSYFELRTGIVEGARDSATGSFVRSVLVDGEPADVIATNQELQSYTPFLINQNVRHTKLVFDNSLAVGDGRVTARVGWQLNRRQESNDVTIPDVANIFYYLNSYTYDVRYITPEFNDYSLSVGANGMVQKSENMGTLLLIPEYNLFDIGPFAILTKSLGDVSLSAGIRYDARTFDGHDNYVDSLGNQANSYDPGAIHQFKAYSSNFNGMSGSLGAAWQVSSDFSLKANVARGFRAPNVAETGSNGIHDGTVVYEIGDPGLDPEHSLQFDLMPGLNSKDFSAELDLFTNMIDEYIYPKQLIAADGTDSVRNDVPGFPNAPAFRYTQGNASFRGGEFSLDIHPSTLPWLDVSGAFSAVDAYLKDTPDSEKYLPFIPPAKLTGDVTFKPREVASSLANLYFRFGVSHVFSQTNVYHASQIYYDLSDEQAAASTSASDPYTLLNLGAGGDIVSHGGTLLSFHIAVENLGDVSYKDYMSRFKYYDVNFAVNPRRVGVYNMGRNISLKVIVPITFAGN